MKCSPKSGGNTNQQHFYRCAAQDKLAVSLAVRECISSLCLNPQQTLDLLKKRRGSNASTSSADLTTTAMCVLTKLFCSLKNDICHSKYNNPDSTQVLHLLGYTKGEPCSEIVDRYVSQWLERRSGVPSVVGLSSSSSKWRQIEVLDPKHTFKSVLIPDSVPPLDAVLVEQCCYSPSADSAKAHNHPDALKVLSYQEIPVDEASSSGESSLSSSSLSLQVKTDQQKLQVLSREVAQEVIKSVRVVQEVVCKVDRSCGPTPRQQSWPSPSTRQEYENKQVQTNGSAIHKIDVGVNTQQNFPSANENKSSSNNSSSYTTSNSSAMYSDLSAGQLPLHKAAIFIARSQCHVVNVLADGSVPAAPMLTSTPKTAQQPRVREVEEAGFQQHQQSQPFANLNIDSYGHAPSRLTTFHRASPSVHEYLPNESTELAPNSLMLMVREMSLGTSFDSLSPKNRSTLHVETASKGREMIVVNDAENSGKAQNKGEGRSNSSANAKSQLYSSENEDEESTLNQISPLPTTG